MRNGLLRTALAGAVLATSAGLAWSGDKPNPNPGRQPVGPKKKGVTRIVFFGDSITGHRPLNAYQNHYVKFADLVGLMIEGVQGPGAVEIINSGWAGDKTTPKPNEYWPGGVGRVKEDLVDLQPDIAVILFGGNDAPKTPEDVKRVQANLKTIASQAVGCGAKVLMLQYHPAMPAPENQAKGWYHLDDVNPIIERVAKDVGAELLHMGPILRAAAKRYPRNQLTNDVDGVHLNPRGEMVYARGIFRKLLELRWVAVSPEALGVRTQGCLTIELNEKLPR